MPLSVLLPRAKRLEKGSLWACILPTVRTCKNNTVQCWTATVDTQYLIVSPVEFHLETALDFIFWRGKSSFEWRVRAGGGWHSPVLFQSIYRCVFSLSFHSMGQNPESIIYKFSWLCNIFICFQFKNLFALVNCARRVCIYQVGVKWIVL